MEDKYELAIRTWVARRVNARAEDISEVGFTTIYGGYCETCSYSTEGIEYYITKNGIRIRESFEYGGNAFDFFKECATILEELK